MRARGDVLDDLLDHASAPSDDPWFATRVVNQARRVGAPSRARIWEGFGLPVFWIRAICGSAIAAILVAVGVFSLDMGGSSPANRIASATVLEKPPVEQESLMASVAVDDIPEEQIVEDLDLVVAELNSEIWQSDFSL